MKINLKFITFCFIIIILGLSYRDAMHGIKTTISIVNGLQAKSLATSAFNNSGGLVTPKVGGSYSVTYLYTLIQKKSRSADFIVTDPAGKNVLGSATKKLGQGWYTNMGNVVLKQGDFIDSKSIPNGTRLAQLGNPNLAPNVKSFVQWFVDNYNKVVLYFNYPSDTNPQYRLYIADPDPGDVKIVAKQIVIPAYTNVVSKWNLN